MNDLQGFCVERPSITPLNPATAALAKLRPARRRPLLSAFLGKAPQDPSLRLRRSRSGSRGDFQQRLRWWASRTRRPVPRVWPDARRGERRRGRAPARAGGRAGRSARGRTVAARRLGRRGRASASGTTQGRDSRAASRALRVGCRPLRSRNDAETSATATGRTSIPSGASALRTRPANARLRCSPAWTAMRAVTCRRSVSATARSRSVGWNPAAPPPRTPGGMIRAVGSMSVGALRSAAGPACATPVGAWFQNADSARRSSASVTASRSLRSEKGGRLASKAR